MSNKETAPTPLQSKLNNLAEIIAKLGSLAGLILFVALFIRFLAQLSTNADRTSDQKAQNFISELPLSFKSLQLISRLQAFLSLRA